MKVDDQAYNEDFKNGGNTGDDYVYDANGNMVEDKNKEITITYNHLNLPVKVSKDYDAEGYIEYTYSATGEKLRKKVVDVNNNSTVYTMYEGNFIYGAVPGQQYKLKMFFQPEGYVEPVDPTDYTLGFGYVYTYKDHLGNVRLSYSDANNNGAIDPNTEILDERNYYPFGLEHKGYNNVVNGVENNYQTYNGKEFEEDIGLNWIDYGARRYMADIGRWTSPDPLAEKYYNPLNPQVYNLFD